LRQLALQIPSDVIPTLDNFVSGHNVEALAALREAVALSVHDTLIYLWGPAGCGKSHLLHGLATALEMSGRPCRTLDARALATTDPLADAALLIDNVEALVPACAERLFHAWNRIREEGGLLVCAGRHAPAALPLAPELASRLAWGAVFRLQGLNDEEKCAALRARAAAQGIPVADDALRYLLARSRRDLPSLMQALERLDLLSLSTRRSITVPLVRELLLDQGDDEPMEPLCD
jgi:DnaA family protein